MDRANAIVVGVGDEDAAARVDRDSGRAAEPRLPRRPITVPGDAVARHGRDASIRSDTSNRIVAGIGDEQPSPASTANPDAGEPNRRRGPSR